jgi:transcriptional regulator with XRE-family HTH domain
MARSTGLGEYLRARRALVRPEDAGLPARGRRRVPGLRREELAALAGISSDYYLRLEQGRDRHPSPQIIEAVARALRLDEDATAYLHGLAQPEVAPHRGPPERAPTSIEHLIASWRETPAFVQDRHLDILAANALASALSPVFSPGVNLVRAVFLDPEVRRLNGDGWDRVAHSAVAGCARWPDRTSMIRGWWSWWGSCRCAVTGSGGCGRATTSRPRRFRAGRFTTRSSARSRCSPNGCPSPAPTGRSWWCITPSRAARPSRHCSAWPA